MKRLKVILTGDTGALGRYLMYKLHCHENEYFIYGLSRQKEGMDDEMWAQHREHIQCDITNEKEVVDVVRTIGPVDVLINNAGVAFMNHSLTTPVSTMQKALDVNVIGTFLMTREVAKMMISIGGGRIINLTTVAVPLSLAGEAAYVASKAAVEALTKVMAREYAPLGIALNAVGPGPIALEGNVIGLAKEISDEKMRALYEKLSTKAPSSVADVCITVMKMIEMPRSVTGQVIYLGGP